MAFNLNTVAPATIKENATANIHQEVDAHGVERNANDVGEENNKPTNMFNLDKNIDTNLDASMVSFGEMTIPKITKDVAALSMSNTSTTCVWAAELTEAVTNRIKDLDEGYDVTNLMMGSNDTVFRAMTIASSINDINHIAYEDDPSSLFPMTKPKLVIATGKAEGAGINTIGSLASTLESLFSNRGTNTELAYATRRLADTVDIGSLTIFMDEITAQRSDKDTIIIYLPDVDALIESMLDGSSASRY